MLTNYDLENLEFFYLNKIENLIKSNVFNIHTYFNSKKYLRNYWTNYGATGSISESSIGIERIIYNLFYNFGSPVAAPTGSDLFFETPDAFIHIDVKTFVTKNINDARKNIPVGDNQNSYSGNITSQYSKISSISYTGNLPHYYTFILNQVILIKPCLTYFLVFITDEYTDEILGIFVTCMPNGQLKNIYGDSILSPGKNPGKIRFNYSGLKFMSLFNTPYRTIMLYCDNIRITSIFIS